jgi:hypothetical protein
MIDNYDKIKPFLVFDSDDDFYHLHILKRKKENPDLGSNSLTLQTFYITSIEYLDKYYEEIKEHCNFSNARAMINLNRRSFKKNAYQLNALLSQHMLNGDYYAVRKAYQTICGKFGNEKKENRKWIIDIDDLDTTYLYEVGEYIKTLEPYNKKNKILTVLDTKSGYHIITNPFRLDSFKLEFPELEIKKNNPTNLYIP